MGKKLKSKKVNIVIAPGNWRRLRQFADEYNLSDARTSSRLNCTDIVNEALDEFLKPARDGKRPSGK